MHNYWIIITAIIVSCRHYHYQVRILSKGATFQGLQEHIHVDDIPEYYGGNLKYAPVKDQRDPKDGARYSHPDTVGMYEYVSKLNARCREGGPKSEFDKVDPSTPRNMPPGEAGSGNPAIMTAESMDCSVQSLHGEDV